MADPADDERAPLLRNTSEPSAPPAYSAYGDEGGIRKTNPQIPVSMFNNLTALTQRIISKQNNVISSSDTHRSITSVWTNSQECVI